MKFIVIIARSISPKFVSLIDYFTELDLSFALVTETWLKKEMLDAIKQDIQNEYSLSVIAKNRPLSKEGNVINGGGAAIS